MKRVVLRRGILGVVVTAALCGGPALGEQNRCLEKELPPIAHQFEPQHVSSILLEDMHAEVLLYEGRKDVLSVHELNGPGDLQVDLKGDSLIISQKAVASGNRISVSGSSDTVVKATVNGESFEIRAVPPPQILICIPRLLSLTGRNIRRLTSKAALSQVDINLTGASRADISSVLDRLTAVLSGSATASVSGEFESIDASTDGASRLETRGPVKQDYAAKSGGASSIRHRGQIGGELRKREVFPGRIVSTAQ